MHQSIEQFASAQGAPVYASDGDQIGKVEEIFYDRQTGQPEWVGIGTGFFGTKRVLVPVEGAELREDGLFVPHAKDRVKDSPDIDSDEISQEQEAQLYEYYGLSYSGQSSGTESAQGDSVTLHEEQVDVGREQVQTGRARLRKYVETEPVEMDVELRQETARVTREPIEEPVDGAEIGEQEIEVELRGERPVVQKQTVAKERVGLETDVETERVQVQDEVRKERVDVDED